MKNVKIDVIMLKSTLLLLLALAASCYATSISSSAPADDLKATQEPQNVSQIVEGRTKPDEEATTSQIEQQSASAKSSSARGGRMLDLDHLAGDIGKGEKIARERLQSGDRQSRILSEDILTNAPAASEQRSRKSGKGGKKKMAIKGFIPIISLEHGKDGKHFDGSLDSLTGNDSDQEEEEEEKEQSYGEPQQPYAASQTKEQLLSSYGGHTSIGHASFAPQLNDQQQQPSLTPNNNAWQQINADYNQEAGRARKLLGSSGILSGLTAPGKRLVSTLVSPSPTFLPQPQQIQPPMNLPPQMIMAHQHQYPSDFGECICVHMFQCKNGFLSEAQLSRAQLNQYQSQFAQGHQTPRAIGLNNEQPLGTKADLSNYQEQQHQVLNAFPGQLSSEHREQIGQSDQANVNEMIYEQLRKTIESGQLDQQALQQQQFNLQQPAPYVALDERSRGSGNETRKNTTEGPTGEEVLERSFLNPLGRRSAAQKSCGFMRTCCKLPVHLTSHQPARLIQHQTPRLVNNNRIPMINNQHQPQYQMLHGNSPHSHLLNNSYDPFGNHQAPQQDYQVASSLISSSHSSNSLHQQLQSAKSNFMAGRCGIRQTMGISGRVQNNQPAAGSETTAEFGEFPSHVAILKRLSPGDSMFVCSAVLISNQWVATAAHCIRKHRPEELKIRLGEWDVNRDDEFYPFVESSIRDIVVHPDFQPSSLINDIALLRMEQPVDPQQMPHISPACLPVTNELFDQQRCWVTGWGKDAFGQQGTFQSVLKKVDLPVVGRQNCENALRYGTKLGKYFRLHQSAICAGGERGKDACEGDGGAGLYCHDPETGLTKVAGLVSWGVGCGQKGVPGVYTNLAALGPWIEQQIISSGEENLYIDRNSGSTENLFKSVISERNNEKGS